jgi:hypothetical protein
MHDDRPENLVKNPVWLSPGKKSVPKAAIRAMKEQRQGVNALRTSFIMLSLEAPLGPVPILYMQLVRFLREGLCHDIRRCGLHRQVLKLNKVGLAGITDRVVSDRYMPCAIGKARIFC